MIFTKSSFGGRKIAGRSFLFVPLTRNVKLSKITLDLILFVNGIESNILLINFKDWNDADDMK